MCGISDLWGLRVAPDRSEKRVSLKKLKETWWIAATPSLKVGHQTDAGGGKYIEDETDSNRNDL